jgi:hypothetical protein
MENKISKTSQALRIFFIWLIELVLASLTATLFLYLGIYWFEIGEYFMGIILLVLSSLIFLITLFIISIFAIKDLQILKKTNQVSK